LHRFLEQYWCYQGSYKFFSRNCATEAREDVAAAEGHPVKGFTPRGVMRGLADIGVVDLHALDDEESAVESGLYFPELPDAEDALKVLRKQHPKHSRSLRASRFLEKSTAAEREALLVQMLADSNDESLTAQFYQLEAAVTRVAYEELFKRAGRVLRNSKKEKEGADAREPWLRYEEAIGIYEKVQPWNLVPTRYGIPLANEVRAAQPRATRTRYMKRLQTLKLSLFTLLQEQAPDEWRRHIESQKLTATLLQSLLAQEGVK
jgi:hypothetical protein